MSFFRKPPGKLDTEAVARETVSRLIAAGDGDISIIGPGMQVNGDVVTDGLVRIEGIVEGMVRAGRSVVLGKSGEVRGDIITRDAVICGRVVGTVMAEGRLELQSTAMIEGELRARAQHLRMEEGARFNGKIQMIEEEEPEPMRALPAETGSRADQE
jgi:cytoskeletal protein CcmA (bactofilin family)